MIVFDDSSPANQEKYYPLLEQTKTHNELYYVGPREKEQFLAYLNQRLRDKRLEGLVKNLFRPSYGGNRNYTLMYTLGGLMVSADDDMRPYALMEHSPESLDADEVCRGRLHKAGAERLQPQVVRHPRVLPRRAGQARRRGAGQLRARRAAGGHRDGPGDQRHQGAGARELAAAAARAVAGRRGREDGPDVPLRHQRHRRHRLSSRCSSTTRGRSNPDDLNDLYVLVNFRPVVTKKNWRMDCGVAGYDNTFGLPPFFPTRLRFEDYIYRLWVQQDGIAAAHVDAAQNHTKSNYMRNPPAAEIFNEEVSNLLKRKIKATRLAPRRAEHRVRLRGRGDGAGRRRRSSTRSRALYGRAAGGGRGADQPGARGGAAAVRRQPAKGVLRLRAGLLPAEPAADRRRRRQRHQGLDRAVADAGRDLLLPEGPQGPAAGPGQEPEEAPLYGGCGPSMTNRTGRPALRKRAAEAVRRHRARRSYLTEELVRLGHEVTLFASGDSQTSARLVPACPRALVARPGLPRDAAPPRPADGTGLPRRLPLRRHPLPLPTTCTFRCCAAHPCPSVTTLHGRLHAPTCGPCSTEYPEVPLVSISDDQRRPLPEANWQATVYHGLPARLCTRSATRPGDYLASSAGSRPRSDSTGPSRSPAGPA